MIETEHILKEIDKVIQQAYEKGVKDGMRQAQKQDNILTDEELVTFLAYSKKAKTRIASYRELDEPLL